MMTFRVVHKPSNSHVRCPYRAVEQATGREIDWINKYLDYETLRRLANATLRTYADALLHFLRWWESWSSMRASAFTQRRIEILHPQSSQTETIRKQAGSDRQPSPNEAHEELRIQSARNTEGFAIDRPPRGPEIVHVVLKFIYQSSRRNVFGALFPSSFSAIPSSRSSG